MVFEENEKKMPIYVKMRKESAPFGYWRHYGKNTNSIGALVGNDYRVVETFIGPISCRVLKYFHCLCGDGKSARIIFQPIGNKESRWAFR